jgi:hypothetical protein
MSKITPNISNINASKKETGPDVPVGTHSGPAERRVDDIYRVSVSKSSFA